MTCRNKPGWIFCETEQPKFSDLPAHFAAGVAAEDAIREIEQPKSAAFTVVDVKRSGPIVAGRHDEQQHAFGILDPVSGHTFRGSQEPGNDFRYILFWPHLQIVRAEHLARAHTFRIHISTGRI